MKNPYIYQLPQQKLWPELRRGGSGSCAHRGQRLVTARGQGRSWREVNPGVIGKAGSWAVVQGHWWELQVDASKALKPLTASPESSSIFINSGVSRSESHGILPSSSEMGLCSAHAVPSAWNSPCFLIPRVSLYPSFNVRVRWSSSSVSWPLICSPLLWHQNFMFLFFLFTLLSPWLDHEHLRNGVNNFS